MKSNCIARVRILFLLIWLVVLAAPAALRAELTFEFLKLPNGDVGDLPGGSTFAEAFGVSADGTFVVGNSSSTSSGVMNPLVFGNAIEGFVWDGTTRVMVGVGDLPGGRFSSRGVAVSADGRVVVGNSEETSTVARDPKRSAPFRWTRGNPSVMAPLVNTTQFPNFLFKEPALSAFATATSISDAGDVIVGSSTWVQESSFIFFSRVRSI